MGHLKLKGKDLLKLGYPNNKSITTAIAVMLQQYPDRDKNFVLGILDNIRKDPAAYRADLALGQIAEVLLSLSKVTRQSLNPQRVPYAIFGGEHIHMEAMNQLFTALKLPVAIQGALMPDAHPGYGLPIGGVLAVKQAVIPYGVGLDIGCRMCLSILDTPVSYLSGAKDKYVKALQAHTKFGMHEVQSSPAECEVLDHEAFRQIPLLRKLQGKAWKQLGSSGGGNHFVEFGEVTIHEGETRLGLPPGSYVGLLSHSGSRGLGAAVAQYYTRVAVEHCPLPKEAQHLAWLDLNTHAGMEYWTAMQLAGDYATACHDDIHRRLIRAVGGRVRMRIANHHNFAWKELIHGQEMIVHRKGATPASAGELGLIPASMTAHGYIVAGKGNEEGLNSASHGAGRCFSRQEARQLFSPAQVRAALEKQQVTLIGGSAEEAPMAYKPIEAVMESQRDLVEIIGTFQPRIVRMDK